MNYDNFFNKEYLKDLVDNEDVFIDVFKKTEGYLLYRCDAEGIDVPLSSLRKIENYMSYPVVFQKIIKAPEAKEVALYLGAKSLSHFNITNDLLFSKEFNDIYDGKYQNRLVWFNILNSKPLNKPLSLEQINSQESHLYSYLHPNNSSAEGYNQCSHWFVESLKGFSDEELLSIDPRFLSISEVLNLYKERGVSLYGVPDIGMRSSAGVFYETNGMSNAKLLVQNYKKFYEKYIFSHIDSSIWIDYDKKDKFFDELNTELKKELGCSIETAKEFYSFFLENQDFVYYLMTMDENDGFYNEITVRDIWTKVIKYDLTNFWLKVTELPEFKTEKKLEDLLNNSSQNPMIMATYKYMKFLEVIGDNPFPSTFLSVLNYKEAEAFFNDNDSENLNEKNNFKFKKYFNVNLQNALKKKDKKILDLMAEVFCKNFLSEGEYGALTTFNNIKDVEFIKNSISKMPISLNKHTLARFMLLEIKNNPSNFEFNDTVIDELKEIMKVPDYLKEPLNKYIKKQELSIEELNILKKYGDPAWNNVLNQPSFNLLKIDKDEFNYENTVWEPEEDPFDVFSVVLDNYVNFFDKIDKAFEDGVSDNYLRNEFLNKNDTLRSVVSNVKPNSINKDSKEIAKQTAKMLKEMLILVNKDYILGSGMDGYYHLNSIPSIEQDYVITRKDIENEIKLDALASVVGQCSLFFENLIPEEKENFVKHLVNNLNLTKELWDKFVVIQVHEPEISTFFNVNEPQDTMLTELLKVISKDYKIKDDKDLAESYDVFTNIDLFLADKKIYGKEKLFQILLQYNPGCAAIIRDEDNKIAEDWDGLERFILNELEINKGKDLFTLSDTAFFIRNLDELSLLPDVILNIYKKDKENNDIYKKGNPEGFFKMIESIKSKNPMGYVIALSDLNVREFRNNFNDYCLSKSFSEKRIIENCFDPKVYAQGIWDLFESKFESLRSHERVKEIEEKYIGVKKADIVLNNFYIAQSLNTVLKVDPNLKQECVNALYDLAFNEKNEKGDKAIKMFEYFLKDENKFQQEDILSLITNNYYSNGTQSMKYRKVNFERFIGNKYAEQKDDFKNKLDFFQYVVDSVKIKKDFSVVINDNYPTANFHHFIEKNDRLPELLEVIKNDLSLRKAMNINADDNNVEDDTEDNNLGENNFFKL